jgi:hypothetical protein
MANRSLCLVTIARDEARCIARLLDSVRPWVDSMLVLDTGSRDETATLARAHGAVVQRFDWCDDFAAARNAALSAAAADWHLVLDADEWLIDGGEVLAGLREAAAPFVGAVQLEDHDPDGHGASPMACAWLSRVLPGAIRYAGRIHEQPQHALPVSRLPIRIGHDGYSAATRAAKRGRNRRLLEAALAKQPADAYLWYQLGKDAQIYGEDARAESAFQRAQACGTADQPWWPDLLARRLYGLKRLGRHEDGLMLAQDADVWLSPGPDLPFALGDLLLDWAACCPQRAPELLPAAEAAWRQCLLIGERTDLPSTVPGRGSHLAAHNLGLVLEGTGRAGEALALRRRFRLPETSLLA